MNGERLGHLLDFEALKVAVGVMLLSPFLPLIFMGEEYGETSPFQYFVSHQDPKLIEAVRQGRRSEFKAFRWAGDPPDPQDSATFLRSQLHWQLQEREPHKQLRDFYAELMRMRKRFPALGNSDMSCVEATAVENEKALLLHRWKGEDEIFAVSNFGRDVAQATIFPSQSGWLKILDSRDHCWAGAGSLLPECLWPTQDHAILIEPLSVVVYHSRARGKT